MGVWRWTGYDEHGRQCEEIIQAANRKEAREKLARRGCELASLRYKLPALAALFTPKLKRGELALLTQQWSAALAAGVPLLNVLQLCARHSPNTALRAIISNIAEDVAGGAAFAAALRKHPKLFDALFCGMVTAGEHSGMLPDMIDQATATLRRNTEMQGKLRGALAYPSVLLIVSIGVCTALMTFVVPQFAMTFADANAALPKLTQNVIALSDAIRDNGHLMPGLLVALAVLCWAMRAALRPHSVLLARAALRAPLLGALARNATLARICHTLSLLLAAKIKLPEALQLTEDAAGSIAYRQNLAAIKKDVEGGVPIQAAFRKSNLFPPFFLQMVAIGEESGNLPLALEKSADYFEQLFERQSARILGVLEPAVILLLSGAIGTLILAMYLPIFQLGNSL